MKEKILILVGPTAVGKTDLGIEIAKKFDGEIISGDSMQVYKQLDIGTAKATKAEQKAVPHYLIDEITSEENYTAADFQKKAREQIAVISAKKKLPIVVGGTGLYIEALLYDMSLGGTSKVNDSFRLKKEKEADKKGNLFLWEQLNKLDPSAAATIHFNNRRRVIRALEVYYTTGTLFSNFQSEKKEKERLYDAKIIGLYTTRPLLYKRIEQRVDQMVEDGLEKEAKQQLYNEQLEDSQAAKGIGYKEWFPYFKGEISREDSISKIKQHSRRYAKRQITWFKNRLTNLEWYNLVEFPKEKDDLFKSVQEFLMKDKK